MALITVRQKDNPEGPLLEVDERWVERWPDDFEVVADAEETAIEASKQGPSTQPQAPKGAAGDGEGTGEQPPRGRF